MLNDERQKTLKSRQEGNEWGGLRLLCNTLKMFDIQHASVQHMARFQGRQSLRAELDETLSHNRQLLSQRFQTLRISHLKLLQHLMKADGLNLIGPLPGFMFQTLHDVRYKATGRHSLHLI